MKFFITGSRNFDDELLFKNSLSLMVDIIDSITIEASKEEKPIVQFICDWCLNNGCRLIIDYPKWYPNGEYDKGAVLRQMNKSVADSDAVIVFWDGKSHGAKMVIEKAIKLNKKYKVVKYKDPMSAYFIFSNKNSFLHYEYPCEIFDSRGNKFDDVYSAYLRNKNSLTHSPSEIMYVVNKEKFKQHPKLMEKLKAIEEENIVFDTKADPWGVDFTEEGMKSLGDKDRNILGKILVKIKNE